MTNSEFPITVEWKKPTMGGHRRSTSSWGLAWLSSAYRGLRVFREGVKSLRAPLWLPGASLGYTVLSLALVTRWPLASVFVLGFAAVWGVAVFWVFAMPCDIDRVVNAEHNETPIPVVEFDGTWVRSKVNGELGLIVKLNEGDSTLVKWKSDWKIQNVKTINLERVLVT